MDAPDAQNSSFRTNDVPNRFLQLREPVFRRWRDSVRMAIPEAEKLEHRILTNALTRFFEELTVALKEGRPYSVVTSGIGSSCSHGRERANSTGYGQRELLLELQIFRQVLFEVAEEHALPLNHFYRSIIGRSIDTATLEAASAFANAQKEVNEAFIISLAHDLRNPLSVANASAQLILRKTGEEAITKLAERIGKKIVDIDAMIQTLLDAAFAKGRKGLRLKIVSFDMKALADEVCADMTSSEHPISTISPSIPGYWCLSSMKRLLENLISNAQKYGKPNTPTNLRIRRAGETVVLEVHNEGNPIPEHDRHLLFSTFHRFEDVTVKGWGLGLPFVQLVTESHGGVVNVESTEEDGTTFKIIMPVDCRSYDPNLGK